MWQEVFWISAALVAYGYLGYPVCLKLLSSKIPVHPVQQQVAVSILIAARNEGSNLERKLQNLYALAYPQNLVQIVMVSDGSTDDSEGVLKNHPAVVSVILPESLGKAAALNAGFQHCTGDVIILQDARQMLDADSVSVLVNVLGDRTVGAVSGELVLEDAAGQQSGNALGLYWRIEKLVRRLESDSGSVVGVTGALYAIRRELFPELPPGLILDDVFVPMSVVRQGYRVLFEPGAIVRDRIFEQKGKEFKRKVRTLTGNWQLIQKSPWLLTARNPILFRFVSHKIMRLVTPVLLGLMLVSSACAPGRVMAAVFVLQCAFFLLALVGFAIPDSRRWRIVSVPFTFAMLNVAAAVSLYKFSTQKEVWN